MSDKKIKLTILHTNDTHGKIETVTSFGAMDIGGVVSRSSLINEIRAENSRYDNCYTTVLDLGDILEGDPMSQFFHGEPDILTMNHMGYEASIIGNHELGFSIKSFEKMMEMANFPFLACNLIFHCRHFSLDGPSAIK